MNKATVSAAADEQRKEAKAEAASVVEPIVAVIRDALDQFASEADDAEQRVKAAAADLKTRVASSTKQAKRTGKEAASAVEGYVDDHPWAALGIAFGAGIVLSSMLRR